MVIFQNLSKNGQMSKNKGVWLTDFDFCPRGTSTWQATSHVRTPINDIAWHKEINLCTQLFWFKLKNFIDLV